MDRQEKKTERVGQKQRTRAELLRAARSLIEEGVSPSVADVADHAGISRATAYRYFSTPDEIVREAVLDAVADTITIPPFKDGGDIAGRLDDVVGQIFDMVAGNEGVFRALLANSVTGQGPVRRGGRRVPWLEETLRPLRPAMPAQRFRELVHGLALMTGIETIVVLKDVCGLDIDEARTMTLSAARTLLRGAIAAEPG